MQILVDRGGGYIGSHVVRSLLGQGRGAVVLDNLSTGNATSVPECLLETADLLVPSSLEWCLRDTVPMESSSFMAVRWLASLWLSPTRATKTT